MPGEWVAVRRVLGLVVPLLAVVAACGGATATPGATANLGPTLAADPTDPSPLLPVAVIRAADATIAGELGSYAMDGRGVDVPWPGLSGLPTLSIGPLERLTTALIDDAPIDDWSAAIASVADTAGIKTRAVGGALSPDHRSLHLGPIPSGAWVLAIRLIRADGRGDGATFWAITVR